MTTPTPPVTPLLTPSVLAELKKHAAMKVADFTESESWTRFVDLCWTHRYALLAAAEREQKAEAEVLDFCAQLGRAHQHIAELEGAIATPAAVWANMLRGTIARPVALDHYEECKERVERLEAHLQESDALKWQFKERVKELEAEIAALRTSLGDVATCSSDKIMALQKRIAELEAALKLAVTGCGNHGCKFTKPIGQGTNGPCMCVFTMRKALKGGGE